MKSCIRIPRITLPREDFEYWAVPPVDSPQEGIWEQIAKYVGEKPSLMGCMIPDVYLDGEDGEQFSLMQKFTCLQLRKERFERLYRGAICVERTTSAGIRRGIVACLDLEAMDGDSPVRYTTALERDLVRRRVAVRRESMLEFPHTMLLYRDKRDKIMRAALGEDRELLYDFALPLGGGNVKGYFLPDVDAVPLMRGLLSRVDFFYVGDGNHSLAAAKAYWEEVKAPLSEERRQNHPARFTLVEFVNDAEEGIFLRPLHRLVKEIETEAFCDFFTKKIKCRREGNILYPAITGPEGCCEAEELIREFVGKNYGRIVRTFEDPRAYVDGEDCAFVVFPKIGKEELFSAAKSGKKFPAKSFCPGETDARYSFEGREITYD